MNTSPESPPEGAAWIETPDIPVVSVSGACYFGRIAGNEVVVPDARTSRRHAVVQRQGSRFVIVDLGSTNGTILNGRRIFKPTLLADGDVIGIGGLRYVFHHPGSAGPATQAPVPTSAAVGITSCWIMLASGPEAGGPEALAWAEGLARAAREAGAKARRIRSPAVLIHWRQELAPVEAVRSFVQAVALRPLPAGAHVALHHGAARVGPGAGPSEETLLGSAVSFAHALEAAARARGVPVLASGAAVRTLGLGPSAAPLGELPVAGLPGTHELFSLGAPRPGRP